MQRQYQMMQMQLLQQKIQEQMQKQYNIKNEAQQHNQRNRGPQNHGNVGPGPNQGPNKPNMNSNMNSKMQHQQNKPSQNQSNNLNNSRNANMPSNKSSNDTKNAIQSQEQTSNKMGNKGPQGQNVSANASKPTNTRPQSQNKGQDKNESPGNLNKDTKGSPINPNQRFGNNPKDNHSNQPPMNQGQGSIRNQPAGNPQGVRSSAGNPQGVRSNAGNPQGVRSNAGNPQGVRSRTPVKTEMKGEWNSPNVNNKGPGPARSSQGSYKDNYDPQIQDGYGRPGQGLNHPQDFNSKNITRGSPGNYGHGGGPNPSWTHSKNMPHGQDNSLNRSGKNTSGGEPRSNMPKKSAGYGGGGGSGYKGKNFYGQDKIKQKLHEMFNGPQVDLPALDVSEKKFNAYARLFIGNIPKNCEQKEVVTMFEKYGEIGSVYLNKESSFAFINFDYKVNAAKAMRELDNTLVKNRYLKVRFATISEGVRVKNLSPYVSNELLEKCFSIFGMIESCRIVVDDRGASKGEGIIIFRDKKAAILAVKKCQEECYFLSGALRPVIAQPLEPTDDNEDGLPEASVPKNDEYQSERSIAPHIADHGSFEYEFGLQWKQLYSMYDEKKSTLDRDFQIEVERLEKKMVLAKVEYETEKLRKELAQREAESAELRRHFEFTSSSPAAIGPSCGSAAGNYDSYPVGKRPLDSGYDSSSFNGPYESSYNDSYDRGGYPSSDYDRNYDQGYLGGYGRDEFRRESGYGPENPYDRPYDRPADIPSERPGFEPSTDPGYLSNPPETPVVINDAYKVPSKRPRY